MTLSFFPFGLWWYRLWSVHPRSRTTVAPQLELSEGLRRPSTPITFFEGRKLVTEPSQMNISSRATIFCDETSTGKALDGYFGPKIHAVPLLLSARGLKA